MVQNSHQLDYLDLIPIQVYLIVSPTYAATRLPDDLIK